VVFKQSKLTSPSGATFDRAVVSHFEAHANSPPQATSISTYPADKHFLSPPGSLPYPLCCSNMSSFVYGEEKTCKKCKTALDTVHDRQKSTGNYWKSCLRCRDAETSKKRIKKGFAPRASRVEKYHGASGKLMNVRGPAAKTGPTMPPPIPSYTGFPGLSMFERIRAMQRAEDIRPYHESGQAAQVKDRFASFTKPPTRHNAELDCSVCGNTYGVQNFPHIERCSHEPRVCQECFANWLTSQVVNISWDRIVCPSTGCGVLVAHEEMKKLATTETWTRQVTIRTFTTNIILTTA
jgi:hypothetical protein